MAEPLTADDGATMATALEDLTSWVMEENADDVAFRIHLAEAEVARLRGDLDRAHQELRQGWPKMTYEANAAAIEAMNERDAALAEVERLRSLLPQQITAAEELEALPLGAKVLNAVGECFEVQDGRRFHGLDGITTGAANAFERWGAFSPLSVVWRPERTEP